MWRVGLCYAVIFCISLAVIGRILYLQIVEGDEWKSRAQSISQKDITVYANRGDICAADGRLLASSIPYYELRMDFQAPGLTNDIFKKNVDSLALCLSKFFGDKSQANYRKQLWNAKFHSKKNRYVLINRRKVNYNELKKIKTFPLFRLPPNKGGLICLQENNRVQPHINLASRTIGYLNKSNSNEQIGIVGLEGLFENDLKGINGISIMQKMSDKWLPVNQVDPKDGNDIITTIDINFQDVAQSALLQQLQEYRADHGTAILMEVKTGAIKAIANLGLNKETNTYEEIYNYAIGEATEPGSTFKLASMMALLEDGYIEPSDSIKTGNGEIRFYNHKMRDSRIGGYGTITIQEAFEKSSNVAISKLVNQFYKDNPSNFINRLYEFRLNKPLDLDIKGEGHPQIKYPGDEGWSGISLPWMSIGYEVQQTPLQTLCFYNAIANNGKMMKPKFVNEIRFHGKTLTQFDEVVLKRSLCSKATLKKVKAMLEGVVLRGTATNLKNPNYSIAGKTGTAQIADKNKGYKHKVYQASFAGYFPADDPKYSCIVVINSPDVRKGFYGNQVAGPVFKTIADKVYAMTYAMHPPKFDKELIETKVPISLSGHKNDLDNIFKELEIPVDNNETLSEWVTTLSQDSIVKFNTRTVTNNLTPNVKGMGLQDALYILENAGLKVTVVGFGTVKRQSILPGTDFRPGDKIKIELS